MKRSILLMILMLFCCGLTVEAQRITLIRTPIQSGNISSWNDVSPDGRLVSGTFREASTSITYPFVWSATEGFRYLTLQGDLTSDTSQSFHGRAHGMSGGGMVFGYRWLQGAYRWRPGQALQMLRTPSGADNATPHAASWDGSVVVGSDTRGRAVVWNASGVPRTIIQGSARDVSADGRFVVGGIMGDDGLGAFLWTQETGILRLPAWGGTAYGVSDDGQVVVGDGLVQGRAGAFRWTAEAGATIISPTGWDNSVARHVSADGAIVVGAVSRGGSANAFRWTESGGFELLTDTYRHLLPADMILEGVSSMSPDGRFLIGYADRPGRTYVYLLDTMIPEPSGVLLLGLGLGLFWKRRKVK
ncbi:MAG: PEP-CTERM sorting domain-containing protein [Fimbriimonadia bacterium]|nr:PEP-CTERM sorting domain-containing protein [Phycisphaeraceae bacterium]MCW5935380.1 PEP-CTERM sorting domain-containing protein [Fimbriimonadia bacterium]